MSTCSRHFKCVHAWNMLLSVANASYSTRKAGRPHTGQDAQESQGLPPERAQYPNNDSGMFNELTTQSTAHGQQNPLSPAFPVSRFAHHS